MAAGHINSASDAQAAAGEKVVASTGADGGGAEDSVEGAVSGAGPLGHGMPGQGDYSQQPVAGQAAEQPLTTHEAVDLHAQLAAMQAHRDELYAHCGRMAHEAAALQAHWEQQAGAWAAERADLWQQLEAIRAQAAAASEASGESPNPSKPADAAAEEGSDAEALQQRLAAAQSEAADLRSQLADLLQWRTESEARLRQAEQDKGREREAAAQRPVISPAAAPVKLAALPTVKVAARASSAAGTGASPTSAALAAAASAAPSISPRSAPASARSAVQRCEAGCQATLHPSSAPAPASYYGRSTGKDKKAGSLLRSTLRLLLVSLAVPVFLILLEAGRLAPSSIARDLHALSSRSPDMGRLVHLTPNDGCVRLLGQAVPLCVPVEWLRDASSSPPVPVPVACSPCPVAEPCPLPLPCPVPEPCPLPEQHGHPEAAVDKDRHAAHPVAQGEVDDDRGQALDAVAIDADGSMTVAQAPAARPLADGHGHGHDDELASAATDGPVNDQDAASSTPAVEAAPPAGPAAEVQGPSQRDPEGLDQGRVDGGASIGSVERSLQEPEQQALHQQHEEERGGENNDALQAQPSDDTQSMQPEMLLVETLVDTPVSVDGGPVETTTEAGHVSNESSSGATGTNVDEAIAAAEKILQEGIGTEHAAHHADDWRGGLASVAT